MQVTQAQQIHQLLGIGMFDGVKLAHGNKNASTTKSGPGRYHKAAHSKDSPHQSKGAPSGFVLHTASPEKQSRRRLVAFVGIRQHKKDCRVNRAADRAAA